MDQPNPDQPLEIVGVDVELVDGGYMLTHRGSGDTAIVQTAEQAEIEGIALRVVASWRTQEQEIPFRTGDPT